MVTKAEAEQVVKDTDIDLKSAVLNRRMVHDALAKAELLESRERRLAIIEIATALWLKSLVQRGNLYPAFEAFLWAYFSRIESVEQHVRPLVATGRIYDDAMAIYGDYLREMFDASGKTRTQFYSEMCTEVGAHASLDSADFGEAAKRFSDMVAGTLHEEHLLVAYSVRLFLKIFMARQHRDSAPMADEEMEVVYRHFEKSLPICDKFMNYAKSDSVLSSSLDSGSFLQIN